MQLCFHTMDTAELIPRVGLSWAVSLVYPLTHPCGDTRAGQGGYPAPPLFRGVGEVMCIDKGQGTRVDTPRHHCVEHASRHVLY